MSTAKFRPFSLLLAAILMGCQAHDSFPAHLPDPVGHADGVHALPWMTDIAPNAKVTAVTSPAATQKLVSISPEGDRAYVVQNDDLRERESQTEWVYFERLGQTYRIDGLPEYYRPFSDLAWPTARYLMFDRWTTPHMGVHYIVDVEQHRLVQAAVFSDGHVP